MVGMPWPFHMAFLDSRQMSADIRGTIRTSVNEMRRYADVIFAFSLGNEIRSDIVRWHGARAVSRFMGDLYDLGKSIAPDSLFTYSNYPSSEYLDLSFLDFICFNVYLHREPDFRRYLTHLMAATGERPLVLSETGMDTIREGEEHQAELLTWQARAAFELGLSGFVVFAFTDEWHTGGADITDWAFGLVTRERTRKRAFEAVGEVFRSPLPPPLKESPRASVVVPAYNAQATLGACIDSLAHLNYPDYEIIVVDDGSSDSTGEIAARAGVQRDPRGASRPGVRAQPRDRGRHGKLRRLHRRRRARRSRLALPSGGNPDASQRSGRRRPQFRAATRLGASQPRSPPRPDSRARFAPATTRSSRCADAT